jgi:hypothetical protein
VNWMPARTSNSRRSFLGAEEFSVEPKIK